MLNYAFRATEESGEKAAEEILEAFNYLRETYGDYCFFRFMLNITVPDDVVIPNEQKLRSLGVDINIDDSHRGL